MMIRATPYSTHVPRAALWRACATAVLWALVCGAIAQTPLSELRLLDSLSSRYFAEGRWQALAALGRRYDPPMAWAHWYRRTGIAAARTGRFALAIRQLQRALDLDAGDRVAALWLRYALAMADRYDEWFARAARAAPTVQRLAGRGPLGTTDFFGEVLWRQSNRPDSFPSQALATLGVVQRPHPRWRVVHALSLLTQPAATPFRQTDYYLSTTYVREAMQASASWHGLWFEGQQLAPTPTDTAQAIPLAQRAHALTTGMRWHVGAWTFALWGSLIRARTYAADTLAGRTDVTQLGLRIRYAHTLGRHHLRFALAPQYHRSSPGAARWPLQLTLLWQPLDRDWSLGLEWFAQQDMVLFGESLGYVLNNNPYAACQRWALTWRKPIGPYLWYLLLQRESKQSATRTPFQYYSIVVGINRSI